MHAVKVSKDYFVSSQNALLIPRKDFGTRKFISLGGTSAPGIFRSASLPSLAWLDKRPGLKVTKRIASLVQKSTPKKNAAATTSAMRS
ncbi:hypothetical protein BgiBS90_020927, partial [Biomphalaria glabrata]